MGIIWTLIVGALIGAIAGALTKKGGSMGWIANIAAGLIGSYVGQALFGSWGLTLAGMALFPSIIGAVIVVIITSFVLINQTKGISIIIEMVE
ncbi:GlsB/YeaQ/YmgE family stress response membrane protein [Streptococcus equi subsp. zooepidemicus]|uniref:GlsB/YeaQ/YmgE family stress response membrane protein n=1 Tax=Streptococcus equi TaxID=1336 RepID=UPI001E4082DE|nr:GlsB/YeaQ/YmgE family stress response membrane protein [Streptococcus equi]MCD3416586.1 GlsB/YeaQ/YmgE family stress response membrane protein [Streptococcus equi subsp. zooepidemicus]